MCKIPELGGVGKIAIFRDQEWRGSFFIILWEWNYIFTGCIFLYFDIFLLQAESPKTRTVMVAEAILLFYLKSHQRLEKELIFPRLQNRKKIVRPRVKFFSPNWHFLQFFLSLRIVIESPNCWYSYKKLDKIENIENLFNHDYSFLKSSFVVQLSNVNWSLFALREKIVKMVTCSDRKDISRVDQGSIVNNFLHDIRTFSKC